MADAAKTLAEVAQWNALTEACANASATLMRFDLDALVATAEQIQRQAPDVAPELWETKREAFKADLALVRAARPLWWLARNCGADCV